MQEPLILASASPRRKDLLTEIGVKFVIEPASIDESIKVGESPSEMVARLSEEKALAVAERYGTRWVLGADTTVVCDGKILGKPTDSKEAIEMLSFIQGRKHEVWGGFSLVNKSLDLIHTETHMTLVTLVALSYEEIVSYVSTGEPLDKAGSYAIQGKGSSFVESVNGSYTNVVGLNVVAVLKTLKLHGYK